MRNIDERKKIASSCSCVRAWEAGRVLIGRVLLLQAVTGVLYAECMERTSGLVLRESHYFTTS